MDNPVFEDGTTATVVPAPASPAPQPQMQHVHIRLVAESHKSEGSNMIETANYIDEYNIVNWICFVAIQNGYILWRIEIVETLVKQ